MVGAIILAAGSSSRLGQSKQLLKIGNETLIARIVRIVKMSKVDVPVVVLGSEFERHFSALSGSNIKTTYNSEWQEGIGSSIKAGLAFLLNGHPQVTSVIILTCDQVALSSEHLNAIIQRHKTTGASVVASSYHSTVGVPALFSKIHFPALQELHGSQGAKSLIQKYSSEVQSIAFEGGSVDIDTLEDYQNFIRSFTNG